MQNQIKVLLHQYRVQIVQTESDQVSHWQLGIVRLISHCTAIHHFRRVPKMLPNKSFKSGAGIFHGNTGIFRRHSGCLWLLPLLPLHLLLFFFSFSFVRVWRPRRSKGALLPLKATNRSLDSSEISRDRFLTRRVISSSLISRDLVARDLVTPLVNNIDHKCYGIQQT